MYSLSNVTSQMPNSEWSNRYVCIFSTKFLVCPMKQAPVLVHIKHGHKVLPTAGEVSSVTVHDEYTFSINNLNSYNAHYHMAKRSMHFLIDGHGGPRKMFSLNSISQAMWCFFNTSKVVGCYLLYLLHMFRNFCQKDVESWVQNSIYMTIEFKGHLRGVT